MNHIVRAGQHSKPLATLGLAVPSDTLRAALETPMAQVFTDGGYDLRPGAWKLPAIVTPEMAGEAKQHLAFVETSQMATAEAGTVDKWLTALGATVASSSALTDNDVEVKVSALLSMLDDYPAGVFTKATLKRAAKQFTFFPSFAELSKLLDEEAAALRTKRDRLKLLSAGARSPATVAAEEPIDRSEERQEAVRKLLEANGIALKKPPTAVHRQEPANEPSRPDGAA